MIGAHRNNEGKFIWPNGTSDEFSEYTYWDKGEPGNYGGKKECTQNCVEKCATFYGSESDDYRWHDVPCSEKYRFICQYEDCDDDEKDGTCFEGISYNVFESKEAFKNAEKMCTSYGGKLAVINNERIKNFILGLLRLHSTPRLNKYVAFFFQKDKFWGTILQYFAIHSQLTIIIGLCMDAGESLTSKFLRTKGMQFLGRISLSLYLLHFAIMGFINLTINGPQSYETEAEFYEAYIKGDIYVPLGAPLILIIISPIISFIATRYFEEPTSNILKGHK